MQGKLTRKRDSTRPRSRMLLKSTSMRLRRQLLRFKTEWFLVPLLTCKRAALAKTATAQSRPVRPRSERARQAESGSLDRGSTRTPILPRRIRTSATTETRSSRQLPCRLAASLTMLALPHQNRHRELTAPNSSAAIMVSQLVVL